MTDQEINLICDFVKSLRTDPESYSATASTNDAVVTNEAPRCKVHTYKDEPVVLMKREYNGKTWYDHRSQINGVWKKCYGDGFKEPKTS